MQPNQFPPGGYGPPPGGGGYGPPPGGGGYGPPPGFAPGQVGGGGGGGSGNAEGMVGPPAIALIVTAVIGILAQLVNILLRLLGMGMSGVVAASGDSSGVAGLLSGVVGLVFAIIWLLMSGVVIFGAIKMKSLQSYGLAFAAAVLAAVPCTSPCCFIGLPVGIWAIVVLLNDDVKRSFR
jgi:hypothetical protein